MSDLFAPITEKPVTGQPKLLTLTHSDFGIVQNMSDKNYHAAKALGSSTLKRFHDCPAGVLESFEPSEDMALGSAQDSYTLCGPEHFKKNFVVMPDFGDMRKVVNREDRDTYIRDCALENLTVLPRTVTTKNIPTMQAIIDVDNFLCREHPMTKIIFRRGEQQLSLFWRDQDTGLPCKARYDHLPDERYKTVFDLKKCARLDNFHNQIERLRYFLQGGHYTIGGQKNGLDILSFGFVGFNFGDPPTVRIIVMDDDYMEKGMRLARNTVSMIAECIAAGKFPRHSIPLETVSIAKMLGLKSAIAKQLEPQELMEIATTPYSLRAA